MSVQYTALAEPRTFSPVSCRFLPVCALFMKECLAFATRDLLVFRVKGSRVKLGMTMATGGSGRLSNISIN